MFSEHGVDEVITYVGGSYRFDRRLITLDIDFLAGDVSLAPRVIRTWLEPLVGIDHAHFTGDKAHIERLCRQHKRPETDSVVQVPEVVIAELDRWLDLRAAHDEKAQTIRQWLDSVSAVPATA